METVWFWLVGGMLAGYVVLDGYDLGAGIIHLLAGKKDDERRQIIESIGPLWDGNEVWLIAAGGTLYFAFPLLYASALSGFYLPVMIVLWLLIFRGISIEFRNHVPSPVWYPLWDVAFSASSLLLALFFGAALGNIVRGVPMDASGSFFEPLWTDWRLGADTGILDWYTMLAGATVVVALALHGAFWVRYRTTGAVGQRAERLARAVWWLVVALTLFLTACTWIVQPQVPANFSARPWGWIFPLAALGGLGGARWLLWRNRERSAFVASSVYLAAMLMSVVFGLYPYVLPARDPRFALTVHNTHAGTHGLSIGLVWWTIGMALAVAYVVYVHWRFGGKIRAEGR